MPLDLGKPMFFGDRIDTRGKKKPIGGFGDPANYIGVDVAAEHKDRTFYCGQEDPEHILECLSERTCFNHIVGLPISKTTGRFLPIFDYEMYLYDEMEGLPNDYTLPELRTQEGIGGRSEAGGVKYLAVKKSRGLGISEFFLRYMAWLGVCHNDEFRNMRMFIVCGPSEQIAVDLIKRIKAILTPLNILQDAPYNVAKFMSVEVYARPGGHVDTLRGYENIKFILVDEASFWVAEEQANELRSVVEGYIAKSRPTIAFISTPRVPGVMFEQIMEESERTCLYKRYYMPYHLGLNKIYTPEDIENARLSPNFEREYNLKYGVGIGNIFEDKQIDDILIPLTYQEDPTLQGVLRPLIYRPPSVSPSLKADGSEGILPNEASVASHTQAGAEAIGRGAYVGENDTTIQASVKQQPPQTARVPLHFIAIGCDPGFGSSNASYVITAKLAEPINKVIVLEAKQFDRSSFRWFANLIFDKYNEYNCAKIFVDASARDVVDDLKIAFRELTQYEVVQKQAHKDYSFDLDAWMQRMVVCPIPFNKYNDRMLRSLVSMVYRRDILIPKQFEELILDLRMAREKGGKLDKTGVNGMDLFDALRLACLMYQYQ